MKRAVDAAPGARPSDTQLLDALERFVQEEPLVLWDGIGRFPGGRLSGLSVCDGHRTLRQALEVLTAPNQRTPEAGAASKTEMK